ncbi:hypothetical protein ACJRO7_032888 [Eucalyptus globulus]|uniref:Retrotransposon gag domain-containing protein n=1 Tax=Eucalyptus globulus TaxID=34317 RepID=A0ABD3JPT3_EUCGL
MASPRADVPIVQDNEREDRGRSARRANRSKKARAASCARDPKRDLETRLTAIEESVTDVQAFMDDLHQTVEGAEAGREEFLAEVQELQAGMGELRVEVQGSFMHELQQRDETWEAAMVAMRAEMAEMKGKLVELEAARVNGVITVQSRADAPKPKEYKGSRVAKDVDNFLWYMERYFQTTGRTDDVIRVNTAAMYLSDDALLWWRRRSDGRNTEPIVTWTRFVEEFRRTYYPAYAEEEARGELKRLEQKGGVHEYVKRFSELLLQIPSMTETEAFHQFMGGLKPWVKQELKRCNATDLTTATSVAESLVEYRPANTIKPDFRQREKGNGGGDRGRFPRPNAGRPPSTPHRNQPESSNARYQQKPRTYKCFFCDGPHMARECLKRGKLAALCKEDQPREEARLGSLRILGTIKASKKDKEPKGMMFVDVKIGGTTMSALVDTGASDLFISKEAAKKLHLLVEANKSGWLKTVNSREVPTSGMARGVEFHLGPWTSKEDIEVIPLDDYDFVLGLGFLDRINAGVMSFADCICILDKRCQCMVPIYRESGRDRKMLSAMQLAKGLKKGEATFLAALKEEGAEESSVPEEAS